MAGVDPDATFRRARTEEQREVRRRAILDAAAAMLAEMPVAELSLNELSRRVGLAKSNVLRYFESREAVLLELLDEGWERWLSDVTERMAGVRSSGRRSTRIDASAQLLAATLGDHPVVCTLMASSAGVLEHNVSPTLVAGYKVGAIQHTRRLADLARSAVPELDESGAYRFASYVFVAVAGLWPIARPSPAVRIAARDPALSTVIVPFVASMAQLLAVLLRGLTSPANT